MDTQRVSDAIDQIIAGLQSLKLALADNPMETTHPTSRAPLGSPEHVSKWRSTIASKPKVECRQCRKMFTRWRRDQICCSQLCYQRRKQDQKEKAIGLCSHCGKTFKKLRADSKFCSGQCYQRAYNLQNRNAQRLDIHYNCKHCSKPFIKKTGQQKYCSIACRARVAGDKEEARVKEAATTLKSTSKRPCTWCGKPTLKNTYCSDSCRKSKERVVADHLKTNAPSATEQKLQEISKNPRNTLPTPKVKTVQHTKPVPNPTTPSLPQSFNWNRAANESRKRLQARAVKGPNQTRSEEVDVQSVIERIRQENANRAFDVSLK